MIDLNYNNHKFTQTNDISWYHYTCEKCNASMFYNKNSVHSKYNIYLNGSIVNLINFKKLTCEEILIKNILE